MKGHRLEVVYDDEGRADLNRCMPLEPGDYVGPLVGYTGEKPSVYFRLPVESEHRDAGLRHITSPPHTFIEEDDGTLTVEPSILAVRPAGQGGGWHGFLRHGEWSGA